ncbi:MAG: alpha-amylase family glycosyl hydrolase, partial [Anaerolineae bacterium]|nr:alpha-amylase family glycosyl hydrolase [Anaerolineae bacterium]
MIRSFRPAWQILRFAMLICVVVLTLSSVFVTTAQIFTSVCAAGNWQTEAGGAADWDPAANPMTHQGNGVYTLGVTLNVAGQYELKVIGNCAWGQEFPSQNYWFSTDQANQQLLIVFDTRTYNDGFTPSTNLVDVNFIGATENIPTNWIAVGAWQGWNNNNLATNLINRGNGIFSNTFTIASAGTYEAKISQLGNWSRQFTSTGRAIDGGTVSFTTTAPNQTITVILNTNTNRFAYRVNARQDNNIWWSDLGHDSRNTLYRTPGGAVPFGTQVKLRFRSAKFDLTGVQIRIWNDRADQQTIAGMTKIYTDDYYDYWEYPLNTGPQANVYYYRFIATDGTATAFYEDSDSLGGWGETIGGSQDRSWQLTVYDPAFQTPDWVQNAVIYQVFVDRFRDGNPANNLAAGSFFYNEAGGTINRSLAVNWNTVICDPRINSNDGCEGSWSRNFYGGDLQGVIDRLDYLETMGVTALYLNPIFEAPSNHKYDARDFSQIDDNFGNLALFQTLAQEAENRGIRIILDGVFNHTSSDSFYFDRYSQYSNATYGSGACEDVNSPFRPMYRFIPPNPPTNPALCDGNVTYPFWFGIFDSLPVLDTAGNMAQDLVWGNGLNHTWSGVTQPVGEYWIAQGADGWRLDVAPEVDHGIQQELTDGREQFNPYWEEFRKAVHGVDPDAYIVGEEWGISTSWTSGGVSGGVTFPNGNPGEWDATMNYQFSTTVLGFWRDTPFTDNDHNSGSSAGVINPFSPSVTNERLLSLQERYAPEAFAAMMNLLGSHDTSRALFMLEHGHPSNPAEGTQFPLNPAHDWSDAITRLKGVALLQLTLPGAPTIYYGDEVGLAGPQTWSGGKWEDDPYNRQPFPWLESGLGTPYYVHLQSDAPNSARDQLLDHYTLLATTRNDNPALRTGDFRPLLMQNFSLSPAVDPLYVYGRRMPNLSNAAVVFINRSTNTQNITVNVLGYLPIGANFDDVMTPAVDTYTVDSNGNLTVTNVPARGGALLVMNSSHSAPPAAPSLSLSSVAAPVVLSWSAVPGADVYDVYRSYLSGGGYQMLGSSATTSYTDTLVETGGKYYYVVVARNTASGIVSSFSNEIYANPQWDLGGSGVVYFMHWPTTLTHTISTTTPTDQVYARITIPGGTDVTVGQTPGITAQAGYGSVANPTDTNWTWFNMAYDSEQGDADQYIGTLLPNQVGSFYYAVRFSVDNGATWSYGDLDGAWDNEVVDLGVLTVNASSDTTPPAAPVLSVSSTSISEIRLAWTASTDDIAVDSYRIYRTQTPPTGYVLIGTVDDAVLTFIDSGVTANQTYTYVVRAVDTSFNLSADSNAITATAENVPVEITFRVTVPANTPAGSVVHIAGNQTVWGPWNPGFAPLTQTSPNVWEGTFTFLNGTDLRFKFTRGNWERVEKAADGSELPDRALLVDSVNGAQQTIDFTVATWRDPFVTAFTPSDGATNVPDNTTVTVTWSKSMPPTTDFTVTGATVGAVTGTFVYDEPTRTVTFTPSSLLAPDTYTVLVTGEVSGPDPQQVETTFSFTVNAAPTATNTPEPTLTNTPGGPTETPVPPTATNTPVPPTATNTPDPNAVELLRNRSFEDDTNPADGVADFWGIRNGSGERRVCDASLARTGVCSFMFIGGGAVEDSILQQRVDLTQFTAFNTGDVLTFNGFARSTGAPNFRIRVIVNYADGSSQRVQMRYNVASGTYVPLIDPITT